jgi:hypothetical protein
MEVSADDWLNLHNGGPRKLVEHFQTKKATYEKLKSTLALNYRYGLVLSVLETDSGCTVFSRVKRAERPVLETGETDGFEWMKMYEERHAPRVWEFRRESECVTFLKSLYDAERSKAKVSNQMVPAADHSGGYHEQGPSANCECMQHVNAWVVRIEAPVD